MRPASGSTTGTSASPTTATQQAAESGSLGFLAFLAMIGTGFWCGSGLRSRLLARGAVSEADLRRAARGWSATASRPCSCTRRTRSTSTLARAARRGAAALRLPHAEHPGGTPVSIARALFWTSGAATAWVLAGYPAALGLLPRRP